MSKEKKNVYKYSEKNSPPDLNTVFSYILNKFNKFRLKNSVSSGNSNKFGVTFFLFFLFFLLFLVYAIAGFYIVKPAEQAVVTRLGKYNRVVEQGPHWIPVFIESRKIINTEKIERSSHYGSSMLTKDENIVTVEIEVQYRINDVEKYLFNLVEPDMALKEAADSALRQVVGYSELDFLMTLGKEQIASEIYEQLQHILDSYNTGIYIAVVALKDVRIPNDVKSSFDDVIKAQEEKEQLKHQAEANANKIIPEAKGEAVRILELANAYKKEVILNAEGDVLRFKLILPQYKLAREITRTRLYLDTIENILSKTTKILIDLNKSSNLVYLPLDRVFGSFNTDGYLGNVKSFKK